jgi:hypothetical protein
MTPTAIEPAPAKETAGVIVVGDVTVDRNLCRSGDHSARAYWASGRQTKASHETGGAALLGRVVKRMAADNFGNAVEVWLPGESCGTRASSFSVWEEHARTKTKGDKAKAWRVAEYLGADPTPLPAAPGGKCPDPPAGAKLLVLDDAGLGFFENTAESAWLMPILSGQPEIVLKMSAWQREDGRFRHVGEGALYEHLIAEHAGRLTLILNISDLRLRDAAVSTDLSWERTGQDLASEFEHNHTLEPLAACQRVVVRLGAAGVFLRERKDGETACTLYYDPAETGDSWESRHPGGVIGYTVCMTAAVAGYFLEQPASRCWKATFERGTGAARELHRQGYKREPAGELRFPLDAVASHLKLNRTEEERKKWPEAELCEAPLPPARHGPACGWTILGARFPDGFEFADGGAVAERVVIVGEEKALGLGSLGNPPADSKTLSVPIASYGGLKTIDRQEIENLRSIGRLVREYCSQTTQTPLSFAVFGPPGCGKSFAIGELADSIIPGKTTKLTFNLSQFSSPAELAEAFHQVRDSALRGEMPLVFWDEFDAKLNVQPLGWLKYFLAPMQDGCFQAGPLTHPVGRAIFAFAGSIRSSMQEFERYTKEKEVADAKGTDFISRLKGFVNVLGPNQPEDAKGAILEGKDPNYVLRRAIILRGNLARGRPLLLDGNGELRIDPGVLRALLLVGKYRHGVRSMASVIAMSSLDGKLKFERSCLPPPAQLDLHVDAAEFLAIIHGIHFDGFDKNKLDRMAIETHQAFYEELVRKGFSYARETDEANLKHACCTTFENLKPSDQEENRRFVRAIPKRLLRVRHVVARLEGGAAGAVLSEDKVELMAELEHERWMWSKLRNGIRYGAKTDRKAGTHECLLTWNAMDAGQRRLRYGEWAGAVGTDPLPEEHKEKDRLLIRAIPRILESAGLQAVSIPGSQPEHTASAAHSRSAAM